MTAQHGGGPEGSQVARSRRGGRLMGPRGALVRGSLLVAASGLVALLVIGAYVLVADQGRSPALAILEGTRVDAVGLPTRRPLQTVGGRLHVEAAFPREGPGAPAQEALASLLLDTGAPTTLTFDLADRIGGDALEPVGRIGQAGLDGVVVEREVVRLPLLRLGDARFLDVGAVRAFLPWDGPTGCRSAEGILGASLMRTAVWQLDARDGSVTIAPDLGGLEHVEGAIAMDFSAHTPASPSPVVEVAVGEGRLPFLLDTGADGWLAVHPEDLASVGASAAQDAAAVSVRATTATGSLVTRVVYGRADVGLGERRWEDLPIATIEALPRGQGSMGMAFLAGFVVTIDWPAGRLYLDPLTPRPRPPEPALARIGWIGDEAVVTGFVEGPVAEAAGLVLGLPVLALDGRPTAGLSREEACTLAREGLPREFEMTVLGGRHVRVEPVDDFFDAL